MKVLALHQPWATLVAIGAKEVETRSWPAEKYDIVGERVAIQATTTGIPKYVLEAHFDRAPHFRAMLEPLAPAGTSEMSDKELAALLWKTLPRGVILATAVVDRSERMTHELIQRVSTQEWVFGDWQVGRYGFFLRDVINLKQPVPFKGHQGVPIVADSLLPIDCF